MRLIDLELYRWKYHNEIYMKFKRVQAAKHQVRPSSFWKEYGAFTSVLPRQVGKTTIIDTLIRNLPEDEPFIVLAPNSNMRQTLITNFGWYPHLVYVAGVQLAGLGHTDRHLFIDEFDYIDRTELDKALNFHWKSVTMVSTLR